MLECAKKPTEYKSRMIGRISIPLSTIADMARNIVYASCNRKKSDPGGYGNGEQAHMRHKFVVIVAYSNCEKGPHRRTSILPPVVVGGKQICGNRAST